MARVRVPITVIDPAGNAVAGAAVTVNKRSTGTAAVLYVAETGPTTTANPTTTDAYGRVTAWVDRGAYNAVISGTGITTYTQPFDAGAASDQGIDDLWLPSGAVAPVVTVLPTGLIDGQEVTYAADAANGVYWHLKCIAAMAGSYKWACLGGAALQTRYNSDYFPSSASWTAMSGAGGTPSIAVPLAGDYDFLFSAHYYQINSGTSSDVGISVNGATPVQPNILYGNNTTGVHIQYPSPARNGRITGLAAGQTLALWARGTVGAMSQPTLQVRPVRVG